MTTRNWSTQQVEIFNWFETGSGNACVVARAGTGKTTVIEHGVSKAPEAKILYAVFNKKNAVEAERRITDDRVEIKTLHSLGYAYIRRQWNAVRPSDDVEDARILAVKNDLPGAVISAIRKTVSFAKNTTIELPTVEALADIVERKDLEPEGYESEGWTAGRIAQLARQAMEKALVRDAAGRISFDDMVWLPVVMKWVRPWFNLVIIDEAQDMSLPQLTMAKGACKRGGRILVVGDPRQAIYGFRGAAPGGMDKMVKELNATVFPLNITYRCAKNIVSAAALLVPDYQFAPTAEDGVVESINEVGMLDQVKVGDAILARKNAPLMGFCLALLRKGTPARIEGRDIGKALLAIVKKLNAKSVPDFLKKVKAWEERQMKRATARAKGADAKIDEISDQEQTLTAVAEGAASVAEIESRIINLFQDTDGNSKPAVVLSSVHKAKGLEWETVFCIQKTFRVQPGTTAGETEEANLTYVATTRAKKVLKWVA